MTTHNAGKMTTIVLPGGATLEIPGPWTAVQGQGAHHRDVYIRAGERVDGDWPAVARCCSSRVGSFATVQANGRLIAAAPDLAEELRKCKETFGRLRDAGVSVGVCAGAISCIEAALAKAEGGAE